MTEKTVNSVPPIPSAPAKGGGLPRFTTERLLGDGREAIIEHGGQEYRLRITAKDKLILTK